MSNNNHNHPSCEFAEQMISYLYGENADGEFKAHLKSCSHCADELADFGFVRSSVIEWRDEEFTKLQTPVFEILTTQAIQPFVSTDSRSWLDGFRSVFNFNLAFAASAIAALLVCGGLIWIALNYSKTMEVAGIDNNNAAKTAASPTVKPINEQPEDNKTKKNQSDKFLKPIIAASNNDRTIAPKNPAIKVSNDTPKNISTNATPIIYVNDTTKKIKKSPSVKKPPAPTLTNAEEEEDDSVRLADLFAEIDTK